MIWTVLDEEKKRDQEKGGTRREEGRGGRRDKEERGTRRKEERGECKNEKVVKKWKTKKSLKDASLASLGLVLKNMFILLWPFLYPNFIDMVPVVSRV